MAKIGLIQVIQRPEDKYEERTQMLYDMAVKCFEDGADLVFFPEEFQHAPNGDLVKDYDAISKVAAEWKARCSELAKRYHAYLVPWDYETTDGKVYNSSYILDRNGQEIGRYSKVHTTPNEAAKGVLSGEDYPVFDLDIGKVGIMICWDNYFPESARCLANNGAQLILYPLYGDTLNPQWEIKLRARAIDNVVHIASSQIDTYHRAAFTGMVAPDGEITERLTEAPSYKVVEIELGKPWVTYTSGSKDFPENIKLMVERSRNPKAYGAVMKEPEIHSWDEIYLDKVPPMG